VLSVAARSASSPVGAVFRARSDSAREVRLGIKKVHVQDQEARTARQVLSCEQERCS
jgi:hypothetical protein